MVSTIGSFILDASTLPFLFYVWKSYKVGRLVTVNDPWGPGNSLEWATTTPPPLRNFDRMPRIRSERPAFDAKYPELAAGDQSSAGPPEGGARPRTSESDGGATYREDQDRRLES
jgi:cytochrome c oxidase subunit 1